MWDQTYQIWIGLGILVVLLMIAGFIIMQLRKRLMLDESDNPTGEIFSLHQLRQMHKAGQITDEEFEAMRDRICMEFKGLADSDAVSSEGSASAHDPEVLEGSEPADTVNTQGMPQRSERWRG